MREDQGRGSFAVVLSGLRRSDDEAAARVHRRFLRRLVALAARQFDGAMRVKADPEGAVQSAFRSLYARLGRGQYEPGGWDELWAMLARITLNKCAKRREFWRARRRDLRREVAREGGAGPSGRDVPAPPPDREPSPSEVASLRELAAGWLGEFGDAERGVIELGLLGLEDAEIARRLRRSERTVRRIRRRAEERLRAELGRVESGVA